MITDKFMQDIGNGAIRLFFQYQIYKKFFRECEIIMNVERGCLADKALDIQQLIAGINTELRKLNEVKK